MSTHIKPTETSNHEPASRGVATEVIDGPPVFVKREPARLAWQLRRYQVALGAAVALIAVAVIGNNLIARQYTAEGAVRQYLSALQSQDAAAAWSESIVLASSQTSAASLTDMSAMKAALGSTKPDIKSFDVLGGVNANGSTATVNVSVSTSAGTKQMTFAVERSGETKWILYPVWRVVLTPVLLTISLPSGAGTVSIDGATVALPAGKSTVSVLPLPHSLVFKGTSLLAPQTAPVDGLSSAQPSVTYAPKFTDAGTAKAKTAINSYFKDVCSKLTIAQPVGGSCPQAVATYLTYPGQWNVIGDPAQDVSVSSDGQNIYALGHYQMVFAYPEHGVHGARHVAQGGGYSALLQVGDDITVTKIDRLTSAAHMQRPAAATDQAAKDLVAKALVQCAAVSAETVADCPQAAPDVIIDNVHWSLTGDPLAGATTNYDPSTGLLAIHGNFSMSVTYTWFGNVRSGSSYIRAYDAYLFWDGQAWQLVTIDGAQS